MNKDQLNEWLKKHGLYAKEFATIIGVTPMAVEHWLSGRRSVSLTVTRLCRVFDKYPGLMKEF